ncbi:hypothetical protein [Moraxella marmotae]|uniref:hypothetical protein n=1 Tax=Moraxella marmotae TaxID=3344520 RepID=UPI003671AC95
MTDLPLILKVFAVIIGAIFALTLSGDIDKEGRLHLNLNVVIKFAFSATFGFLAGGWLIEFQNWTQLSHVSHGFIMMLCSVFGMMIVGVVYQAIRLSTTDKDLSEIISEVKQAFTAIFK